MVRFASRVSQRSHDPVRRMDCAELQFCKGLERGSVGEYEEGWFILYRGARHPTDD